MSVLPVELLLMVAKHLNLCDCRRFVGAFPSARGIFWRTFAFELDTIRKRAEITKIACNGTSVRIHNEHYRLEIQKWRYHDMYNYLTVVYSWRRQTVTDDWKFVHDWRWSSSTCKMIVYGSRECLLYCDICKNKSV